MVVNKAAKVTISLPQHLLDIADRLAEENATSRSSVIAHLIVRVERERIEALMVEGYKAMAEENLREAEEALNITREVILRDG
ncbi:MAG: CopG family transcriptional regulator [Chloroflexi bacterium]|nr:CopG family transcriptional regulator [Chloroflexota bacterium]